jgi:DNA helicase-2/ATP-dependent DNA helicase PcrA
MPEDGTPFEGIEAMVRADALKGRAKRELAKFLELFRNAATELQAQTLGGLIRWVLQESGYIQALEDEAIGDKGSLEAEGRIRNLEEFISAAVEAESLGLHLTEFLDRITLASDADQVDQNARLSLMTIHCAKGLEFPMVFLVGLEEDTFPNRNAIEANDSLEEERRLFYVAITRAQRRLSITAARRRRRGEYVMLCSPSRFLHELPENVLSSPIRWGTQMYQAGQSAQTMPYTAQRGAGGADVAVELKRIRNIFDRAKLQMGQTESQAANIGAAPAGISPAPVPQTEKPSSDTQPGHEAWGKGDRVRSPRFGRGVITGSSGFGDMLTYTIRFECGEKRIVAKFGTLEKDGSA